MSTPHHIRTELKSTIAAGDLPGVVRTLDACRAAGPAAVASFAAVFAPDDDAYRAPLPLHSAVSAGQQGIVAYLLSEGCGVEQRDRHGATPLMKAFSSGQLGVAQQLIDLGADITATTPAGTRVIDFALASGSTTWVDWLLERDLALAGVNERGHTSLHFACRCANLPLILRVHAATGVGFDQPGIDGRRPLDWCRHDAVFSAIRERFPGIAADIPFDDRDWSLHGFAARGCRDIVLRVLDGGSNVATPDHFNNSILHHAVQSGNRDLVEELLERGADIEARNDYGYGPLHWAASAGLLDIVKLLVERGANVDAQGELTFIIDETKTPLCMAIDEGHQEVARYLIEHDADPNLLCDSSNSTATALAAFHGYTDLLRFMLAHGASANGINRDSTLDRPDYSCTPLAQAGNADVVDLLVAHGAQVNAVFGNTLRPDSALRSLVERVDKESLRYASGRDRLGAIAALLRHGARTADDSGSILASAKCVEVMRLLRDAGQSPRDEAPPPKEVAAAREYRGFIRNMANLFSGGKHEEEMIEQETERQRTGLGIVLFEQSLHCHETAKVEMLVEMLRDAATGDVNYVTADSYHNEETILHRLLCSFRCFEPDKDYAPLALLREGVQLLLDKGAECNTIESLYEETPLHKAAKMASAAYGHGQDEAVTGILDDLLDAGADPNIANEDGANVIDLLSHPELVAHVAARGGRFGESPAALFDAVSANQPGQLARLIGGAGNLDGTNGDGYDLLEAWAMERTYDEDWPQALQIVLLLQQHGFVINATTGTGSNALILACYAGAIVQAEWLFDHFDWDLNEQDEDRFSALAALVNAEFREDSDRAMTQDDYDRRRDVLAVRMAERGARIDLEDGDGDTVLSLCPTEDLRNALIAASEQGKA